MDIRSPFKDGSIFPIGAYGYFGTGRDGYSGPRSLDEKALRENSQNTVNKESFIGFTRQSYRPAMEEIFGPVEVLKTAGEFMVWRSEIASAKDILSR